MRDGARSLSLVHTHSVQRRERATQRCCERRKGERERERRESEKELRRAVRLGDVKNARAAAAAAAAAAYTYVCVKRYRDREGKKYTYRRGVQ